MGSDDILQGWNAIAEFLNCDVRTAKRWESKRSLPVRRTWRVHGEGRPNVYADAVELRTWKAAADAATRSRREAASAKRLPATDMPAKIPKRARFGWVWRAVAIALFVISVMAAAVYVVQAHARNIQAREFASPACSSGSGAKR